MKANSRKPLWKANPQEKEHLASFENKCEYMRNLARQCLARELPGVYIFGSPGISKTYTIKHVLPENSYQYIPGKCTGKALFDVIMEHPDALIVLDDVSAIFNEPIAVQMLLAALATSENGKPRKVSYYKSDSRIDVQFTGSIIALSNINLNVKKDPCLEALRSRIKTSHHDVSPEELTAFIRHTAAQGLYGVSAKDCMEIAECLIAELTALDKMNSINLRLFDTCVKTWISWKNKTISFHWRDMLKNDINQVVKENEHQTQQVKATQRTVKAGNKEAVLAIIKSEGKQVLQIELAKRQLGITRATFFNYLSELRTEGKVA